MRRVLLIGVVLVLSGCATHAATSGRVVIQDKGKVVDVVFSDSDRQAIESYYRNGERRGMPPGLARRGGNLPPGLARRDTLPPGLHGESLPYELERRLSTLPSSHVRIRVGHDIVLMDRRTRVVFDVIYGVAG